MIDDVITLIRESAPSYDASGNEIPTSTARQVFCQVRSVSRSEFYQAAQNGLHPEYIFVLSDYREYLGEKLLTYRDWTGTTRTYYVTRTYRPDGSNSIELTAEERVGRQ